MANELLLTRRSFLITSAASAASTICFPNFLRAAPALEKKLKIYNTHTGEWFRGVYAVGNRYVPEAMKDLKKIMRDWRHNKQHDIHPRLYDMMHKLGTHFDTRRPYDLICGFRSPHTNEMLRNKSNGVAKKSLHLTGRAIDVSLNGVPLSRLRDAARALKAGGVGYYPASGFVHLDIRNKVAWW